MAFPGIQNPDWTADLTEAEVVHGNLISNAYHFASQAERLPTPDIINDLRLQVERLRLDVLALTPYVPPE